MILYREGMGEGEEGCEESEVERGEREVPSGFAELDMLEGLG